MMLMMQNYCSLNKGLRNINKRNVNDWPTCNSQLKRYLSAVWIKKLKLTKIKYDNSMSGFKNTRRGKEKGEQV